MSIIFPPSLRPGDAVAIVSPASAVNPDYINGAATHLRQWGFRPVIAPHADGTEGSYSASTDNRLADLKAVLLNPEVRAVLCSRGGYGCVHLLPELATLPLEADPKWLIGFSDVSALHALMQSKRIASIHGSMAKALALHDDDFEPNRRLRAILSGGGIDPLEWAGSEYNRPGVARGRLVGGNLAVLQALISTPYDLLGLSDTILFIEDIAEPIYKVERIIYQLRLSGALNRVAGLIIGQFTDYRPDRNFASMEQMLDNALVGVECPVSFGAPIGHIDNNMPVVEGLQCTLEVSPARSRLIPS